MTDTVLLSNIHLLDGLITKLDPDIRIRGLQFERICEWYLQNDPEYRMLIKKVWLWNKWPGRWGADAGIDLVAQTNDDKLWAIQAKAYSQNHSITKNDLDRFLTESSRKEFSYRLLVATTDRVHRIASHTILSQEKPVGFRLLSDLRKSQINWPLSPESLFAKRAKRHEPLPHQDSAVEDACTKFSGHDRGQLIMACGTGKTFVALWIAERLKSQRTLVIVPSLLLLAKTLRDWTAHASHDFHYLPVCSDETVRGEDHLVSNTTELGFPVTTNPEDVASFLHRNGPSVVFCTYQSSSVIAEAFKISGVPVFDIAIADEAHRCAGLSSSEFATIVAPNAIKARKRLFMTATPRVYSEAVRDKANELECELSSMDDPVKFGPVFHELKFSKAIEKGLLSDYQVAIIGVDDPTYRAYAERGTVVTTDGKNITDARTLSGHIVLAKAIHKYKLRRVISFHSRIKRAKEFSEAFPKIINEMPRESRPEGKLWADYISGEMSSGKRDVLLSRLGNLEQGEYGLLSNARCLGEGVDVPTLDGITFIDPRSSQIDIIQAVGRVIRKADDKKIGTVVLPVFISGEEDEEKVLESSAFKDVWKVLRALRAHDDQLAEELDQLRLEVGKLGTHARKIQLPQKIKVDIPRLITKDFAQAFYIRTVKKTTQLPPLTEKQILKWADEHHRRTDKWPGAKSGPVKAAQDETWSGVNAALEIGLRGLPGGGSLAKLLSEHRGVRNIQGLPPLTLKQILKWTDEYHELEGNWPNKNSKWVNITKGEKWSNIEAALYQGLRRLAGGSSLAKILDEHRGVRNKSDLPQLTKKQILKWADEHYELTGEWPGQKSGAVYAAKEESWSVINNALYKGLRGFSVGGSLAKLLAEHRGVRNIRRPPPLTIKQILKWADEHYKRTGNWPGVKSGPIHAAKGETWLGIHNDLSKGHRGLSSGGSLAKLLAEHRSVRNIKRPPPLTLKQILRWADEHYKRTGKWPNRNSGPVETVQGETWTGIDNSLRQKRRGLLGGSSLVKLLAERRGVRNQKDLLKLKYEIILTWADEHHKRTGKWPKANSGSIHAAKGETWVNVNAAMRNGLRGLPGGSSIAKLLLEHRGVRNKSDLPQLTKKQILTWADEHHKQTGKWPGAKSGPVKAAHGETWGGIDSALYRGLRRLAGGSSVAKLLSERHGVRKIH
jgi:superfamily II DNA or RNA helicase